MDLIMIHGLLAMLLRRKRAKKKKKGEKSATEITLLVENVMAELELVAEEDAELIRLSKPAINKLKSCLSLWRLFSQKTTSSWSINSSENLARTPSRWKLTEYMTIMCFPIDLEHYDRREPLKMAKDLVDKWSRPIFNKSTRFEDMRNFDDEKVPFRRESKFGQSSSMRLTLRPEAMPMDFLLRPQSKIDPDEVRACAKQVVQDQHCLKKQKKLQQLKAPKKKQLQATILSVEGRGMVKYLVLSMGLCMK
ncbi:unnamed protein product [Camellia sinensis]